ncbi:MAG: TetR family transcriptional regulator [Gemmatimonadetes bacterium]|jgi:AcrR family transcriptional regulator|nr:TetR family transcriptional regulator [Gemmatimonadota bacterium]
MPSKRTPKALPRAYHHGDLRSALIQSALGLLRDEGPEALTLRGVARAAGVSQAAPYRHFKDRRALVAAVAEEGFRMLQSAMLHAAQKADGRLGLKQVAIAYVQFGHEHPAEYRIMFGPEVARHDELPDLRETSSAVLAFVQVGLEQLQAAGSIGAGDPAAMAATIWSMLHGLVMLSLDGQTAGVGLTLDQLVDETTRIMMFGMASRT